MCFFCVSLHVSCYVMPSSLCHIMLLSCRHHVSTTSARWFGQSLYALNRIVFLLFSSCWLYVFQGDLLRLIRRVDSNWYEGRVQSSNTGTVGRRGIFPVSYVQTLVEPQSTPTTPVSSAAPSPLPEGLKTVASLIISLVTSKILAYFLFSPLYSCLPKKNTRARVFPPCMWRTGTHRMLFLF